MSARLVIHSGSGKTGTTSIQRWLAVNARQLEEEASVRVLHVQGDSGDGEHYCVAACKSDEANSNFAHRVIRPGKPGVGPRVDRLVGEIAVCASDVETVIISAESLFYAMQAFRKECIHALAEACATHLPISVFQYVRPQPAYLEAAWCQWGFRKTQMTPAEYIRAESRFLEYEKTLQIFAGQENLQFTLRPFVKDMLLGEDVVNDFAHHALGVDAGRYIPLAPANRTLSLDAASLLYRIARSPDDEILRHDQVWYLTRFFGEQSQRDSSFLREVRRSLLTFCQWRHGKGNEVMLERTGWATPRFPTSDTVTEEQAQAALDRVNSLLTTYSSERQHAIVGALIRDMLANQFSGNRGDKNANC